MKASFLFAETWRKNLPSLVPGRKNSGKIEPLFERSQGLGDPRRGNDPVMSYDYIDGVARFAADDFLNRVDPVEGLDLLLWETEISASD